MGFGWALRSWFARGQDTEMLTSLTGRQNVWDMLLAQERTLSEQLLGVGLSNKSFNELSIDSSWLTVYWEQGLVGVAIVGVILVVLLATAALRARSPARACAVFLILHVAISSYSEVGLGDVSLYFLHLAVATSLGRGTLSRWWTRCTASWPMSTGISPLGTRLAAAMRRISPQRWACRAGRWLRGRDPRLRYLRAAVTRLALKTPHRRIGGGRGAALTLVDQFIFSASNFVLGVAIARAGGADALGAFTIAFLIWLTVLGANRALIIEPMTVGDSTNGGDPQLREGMLATLGLSTGIAIILAVVTSLLLIIDVHAVAVLTLAPWIPSLAMHIYWRAMAYRLQRADHALVSDLVVAVTQGSLIFTLVALDVESVSAFLAAWGIGATAGAFAGMRLARVRVTGRGGIAHLRTLWPRSRWFIAEFGTTFPSDQGYQLLLPIMLGTASLGEFRAGASLIGPAVVISLAAANVGLPACVRQLQLHGMSGLAAYTPRLTVGIVALTTIYCGLVAILADPILLLVYGQEFTGAAIVTQLVAAQFALTAIGLGCDIALKAAGQMKQLWAIRAATAVVTIICVSVLPILFGLVGAGLVGVLAAVVYTVGVTMAYRQLRRRGLTSEAANGQHYNSTQG